MACDDTALSQNCAPAGMSSTATDVEEVNFIPDVKKFYGFAILGYTIQDDGHFTLTEFSTFKEAEFGTLDIVAMAEDSYHVNYAFDVENSELVRRLLASDSFELGGEIKFITKSGSLLASVPVRVKK